MSPDHDTCTLERHSAESDVRWAEANDVHWHDCVPTEATRARTAREDEAWSAVLDDRSSEVDRASVARTA